jgi:ribulose-5-phosphate 4-epimerase/fuculose-1-phosphate aldolase
MAAADRLADKYSMSELIYTHISLRVPGPTPTYLLNPYGLLFNQITASSLVKLDFAGNVAGPSEWPVNRAGVAIHGSILEARPEVIGMIERTTRLALEFVAIAQGLVPAGVLLVGAENDALQRRVARFDEVAGSGLGVGRQPVRHGYDVCVAAGG